MKKRYKILIILTIVLVIIGISGKLMIDHIEKNLEKVLTIEIETIDLSQIEDGTYRGAYKQTPIEVIVDVKIVSHHITEIIIIKHVSGQGEGANIIIDDVIDYQSLDVDLISGATYSSKIILLAIYNALS